MSKTIYYEYTERLTKAKISGYAELECDAPEGNGPAWLDALSTWKGKTATEMGIKYQELKCWFHPEQTVILAPNSKR